MKILAGTTCVVFLLLLSSCTQKVSDRFIDDHKNLNKVTTVSIPGWLIKTSLNQIEDFSRDDDLAVYKQLVSHLDGIRFMVSNGPKGIKKQDILQLSKDLSLENGMENYARIKHAEGMFNVWVREEKGEIKNITIIVDQKEFFGIARINCQMPLDVFRSSDFSFNNKEHLTKKDNQL